MGFTCRQPGCGATYTHARSRCRHEREEHRGQLHVCDACGASFSHHHELIHHRRQYHDEEHYICEICDKVFKRRDNYATHMKRHSNEFNCGVCGKVFNRSCDLKRHANNKHREVQHGLGASSEKRQRIDNPRDHYDITKVRVTQSSKFKTTNSVYNITFKELEIDTVPEVLIALQNLFESIIEDITTGTGPKDRIQIAFRTPQLDYPITIPFIQCQELTADTIMIEIERVLQSHEEFLLDSTVEIDVTLVTVPVGLRPRKGYVKLDKYLEKKQSVIRIKNTDNLCLARALVTAKARIDNHPEWPSIRNGNAIQRYMAQDLHELAGVALGPCGIDEAKIFQAVIPGYQINIISKDYFNGIIYEGPEAEKQLYIYHHDRHYDVITSLPAFFNRSYFCTKCHKGYNTVEEHKCNNVCYNCMKIHDETGNEHWITLKGTFVLKITKRKLNTETQLVHKYIDVPVVMRQ